MKKLTVAIILVTSAVTAFASCPVGTRYQCVPWGGKMMCGCM